MHANLRSGASSGKTACTSFPLILLVLILILTGCGQKKDAIENSSSDATASADANTSSNSGTTDGNKPSVAQPSPSCTKKEYEGGAKLIRSQLKAFKDSPPEVAYSFASEEFRARNSLQQFVEIIRNQYSMLLSLKSFTVGECSSSDGYYIFVVSLIDNDGMEYLMQYALSLIDGKWGVEGAMVTSKAG